MKINKILILAGLTTLFVSCSDFLDVNENPNKPTEAEIGKALTGIQTYVGSAFSDELGGAALSSYVFHITSREVDNYSIVPTTSPLGNSWLYAYVYALKDNEALISRADANDLAIYAGIGKLTKAYMFAQLVDLWGDIPYSEAFTNINTPKLDTSKDIYNNLLKLIDEAIADLNNKESVNSLRPKSEDLFYAGNTDKWIRMGNTLKLKLLVQSRKAKSDVTNWDSQLSALLSENNFMKNGEDFEYLHTEKSAPDERHPVYVSEYLGGQSTYYISPWLYETMTGLNLNVTNNPFVNVKDPRTAYFWYNQIKESSTAQADTDYRDGAFVSLFFASNSSYAGSDQRNTSSFVGIYPCGGKYDDGQGGKADKDAGNGLAPDKMLQAYSVPFLLAELYLTGNASGDAKAMLKEGITRSISHVNKVTKASDPSAPLIQTTAETSFVDKILSLYDAASNDGKLQIVMTQKWIANFFNPIEAYSDYRRTGFPIFLSASQQTAYSPYSHTKIPELGPASIPLKGLNAYPRAMWYSNTGEAANNPNVSNTGRNLSSKILFWDK